MVERFGGWVLAAAVAVFVWAGCYVVWSWARVESRQGGQTQASVEMGIADAPIGPGGEMLPPGLDEPIPLVDQADYGVYDTMVFREIASGRYEVELRHRSGQAARVLNVSRYVCVGEGHVSTYVLDVGGEGGVGGDGNGGASKLEVVRCRRTQYTKIPITPMKGSGTTAVSTSVSQSRQRHRHPNSLPV